MFAKVDSSLTQTSFSYAQYRGDTVVQDRRTAEGIAGTMRT